MGLDSYACGNYPTPFIGIFQILLKNPSYSSSNIFREGRNNLIDFIYLPKELFLLILFHLIFSFCSPKPFSVHLPICVQPSLHLLLKEGSLELYHAAQAYLEQQHCWQYALGLYDFLLKGLWSVHSRSSFLPQNLLL